MPTLDFKGKSIIHSCHLGVPFRGLHVDAKKSLPPKGQKTSLDDNLIIHGDNLHALKSLLPQYAGKVKCIYIDPPYNTGNEGWKYNDNVNGPIIKEWLDKEVGIDDLERHDKWLCMMWPRLHLLKELLSDDGVIFVSCDDNEQFRLVAIMEEIFGEDNFVSTLVKQTKIGGGSDTKHIVREHEYIIAYSKNKENIPEMYIKHDENYLKRYREKDERGRFFWDNFSRPGLRQPLNYTITFPDGTEINGDWIRSEKRFHQDVENGEIKFFKKQNGEWSILFKQRLNMRGKKPRSMMNQLGGTIQGKNETREIFANDKAFPYPKSSQMIKYLLESIGSKNAIILDSFAGSGTTAHAVLDLNKEDGGNRKFILVECEDYADKITAERVRRVIKGVPGAKDEKLKKGLGGSFTYCTLGDEINDESLLFGKKLPSYEVLAKYVFYTATGQNLKTVEENEDYFLSTINDNIAFFLIYKPNRKFLRSNQSAIDLDRKRRVEALMKEKNCGKAIVFAPACFSPIKELSQDKITFCQLPFDIHRIIGG